MADTATAPAPATENKRVEKPDEAKFKADVAQAEKEHDTAQKAFVSGAEGMKLNTVNMVNSKMQRQSGTMPEVVVQMTQMTASPNSLLNRKKFVQSKLSTRLPKVHSRTSSRRTTVR